MSSTEEEHLEVRSACSGSSSRSRSSLTQAAVEARAKAEAARARAEFARREIEIKMRQAELSATLEVLKEEKEAEAALAEANVFEAAIAEEVNGETLSTRASENQHGESKQGQNNTQTKLNSQMLSQLPASTQSYSLQSYLGYAPDDYREDLPDSKHFTPIKQWATSPIPDPAASLKYVPHTKQQDIKDEYSSPLSPAVTTHGQHGYKYVSTTPQPVSSFSPYSPPFQPTQFDNGNSDFVNIAKFLAKRDLVTDGLTKFTDTAEDYWAWRASFYNAIEGLSLKPSEELDLLTRWLGEESSKHAKRIRSVHLNNPAEGLRQIWSRLQECYGTPEAIEKSLLDRLELFPRVSNKEPQKLRELGDLLSEIDAAKSDGSLPGLVYLDTSRGIAPIVDKLPINLQDRWMTEGTKYKHRHRVYFPPFSFFCRFIQDEARMRNDPSFKSAASALTSTSATHDNHYTRFVKSRPPVAVHKTEVNKTHNTTSFSASEFTNKQCPIHQKPHSLKMCRGFREKTLDERKAYLREHNICFRCCDSSTHQAKDCEAEITCSECNSNKHIAALHAGPAPWTQNTKAQNTTPDQGGEHREEYGGESSPGLETSSACTQVCGDLSGGRSCSKICQTYVYPKGHPDKKVKVYAIIDDQSNRSLAKSSLFDILDIPMSKLAPYTLRTCTGVSMTNGRIAENLFIQSVDGQFSSPLPSLLECNSLPDNKTEIPTPEVALAYPHLKHLGGQIQTLDPEAEIMLLLGRDIIQVHKVFEGVNGPVHAPFAQRLALGWVIVGDVCLGGAHKPAVVGTYRTSVLENGRPSLQPPCQSSFHVNEQPKSHTTQLSYVPSERNLADHGSRSLPADKLSSSTWLNGPEFLLKPTGSNSQDMFQLQNPDTDIEVRPLLTATIQTSRPCLTRIARTFKLRQSDGQCKGWHMCHELTTSDFKHARETTVKAVQQESFSEELKQIETGKDISKKGPLIKLSPYFDKSDLPTERLSAEAAIINARPLVPVSSDPGSPFILIPATLFTQNIGGPPAPSGNFKDKNLYKQQWRSIQSLANSFWHRWRKKYPSTLQCRRTWHSTSPNLLQGHVVLLKDSLVKRNQ